MIDPQHGFGFLLCGSSPSPQNVSDCCASASIVVDDVFLTNRAFQQSTIGLADEISSSEPEEDVDTSDFSRDDEDASSQAATSSG